jgi:hypothetical protein
MRIQLPPYLIHTQSGYLHTHKNIYIRSSVTNLDPVLKVANDWLKVDDLKQDVIAQDDEIWRNTEILLQEAKTELEMYLILEDMPKSNYKYKDLCENTIAHRLILGLKKCDPERVGNFWYLIQDKMKPYMDKVNKFGHTPWELMGACCVAFANVIKENASQIYALIPIRTWRATDAFKVAWATMPYAQKELIVRGMTTHRTDLLCYLSNPDEFNLLVKLNPNLLFGFTLELKSKYPEYIQIIINNALEFGYDTIVTYLITG